MCLLGGESSGHEPALDREETEGQGKPQEDRGGEVRKPGAGPGDTAVDGENGTQGKCLFCREQLGFFLVTFFCGFFSGCREKLPDPQTKEDPSGKCSRGGHGKIGAEQAADDKGDAENNGGDPRNQDPGKRGNHNMVSSIGKRGGKNIRAQGEHEKKGRKKIRHRQTFIKYV